MQLGIPRLPGGPTWWIFHSLGGSPFDQDPVANYRQSTIGHYLWEPQQMRAMHAYYHIDIVEGQYSLEVYGPVLLADREACGS